MCWFIKARGDFLTKSGTAPELLSVAWSSMQNICRWWWVSYVIRTLIYQMRRLIGHIADLMLVWPLTANPIMNQMQIHNNSSKQSGLVPGLGLSFCLFLISLADHLRRWERWSIKWVALEIHPYWIMTILPRQPKEFLPRTSWSLFKGIKWASWQGVNERWQGEEREESHL